MNTRTQARRFHAELTANTDAFYADALSYEAFSVAQSATWDRIVSAGKAVHNAVLALVRADLPTVRR